MAIQHDPKFATLLGLRVGGDLGGLTYYTNKRGKPVFFPKAPPTKPPTTRQTHQRNLFRLAAIFWKKITPAQQLEYERCTRRASLCMNGYDLFVHFHTTLDQATKNTLQCQTGTELV